MNHVICSDCGHAWTVQVEHLDRSSLVDAIVERCSYPIPAEFVHLLKSDADLIDLGWNLRLPEQTQQRDLMVEFNGSHLLEFGPIVLSDSAPLLINEYLCHEWGIPQKHLLLDGDGHTWVALDFTADAEHPSVCFIATNPFRKLTLFSDVNHMLAARQAMPEDDSMAVSQGSEFLPEPR